MCHGAATEDADALCFGAPLLIRNLFSTDQKKRPTLEVNLKRTLEQLDIEMDMFIDFCILSGFFFFFLFSYQIIIYAK